MGYVECSGEVYETDSVIGTLCNDEWCLLADSGFCDNCLPVLQRLGVDEGTVRLIKSMDQGRSHWATPHRPDSSLKLLYSKQPKLGLTQEFVVDCALFQSIFAR